MGTAGTTGLPGAPETPSLNYAFEEPSPGLAANPTRPESPHR